MDSGDKKRSRSSVCVLGGGAGWGGASTRLETEGCGPRGGPPLSSCWGWAMPPRAGAERLQRGGQHGGAWARRRVLLLGGQRARSGAQKSAKGGIMDSLSSAASSVGGAAVGAAGAVGGTAMNDAYDESCVMCEYILEQVDKMIKAQPRLMQGNGFYPGTVDFGGGSRATTAYTKVRTWKWASSKRRPRESMTGLKSGRKRACRTKAPPLVRRNGTDGRVAGGAGTTSVPRQ